MGSYTGHDHHEDPSDSDSLVLVREGNMFRIESPHLPLCIANQCPAGAR